MRHIGSGLEHTSSSVRTEASPSPRGVGVLLTRPTQAGLAQRVTRLLAAAWPRLQVSVLDGPPTADAAMPALLLPLVDDAGLDAAVEALAACRSRAGGCPVIAIAVDLDAAATGRLLTAGASDFIRASLIDDELQLRCTRVLGGLLDVPLHTAQAVPVPVPVPDAHRPAALRKLVGGSPAFMRQVDRLPLLARYDAGVLILGETGTGKEVCAQAIHYLSPRAGKPWVALNCGAIPTELVEAELFGHVKGAYTHAHAARPGLVREAEGGTLFLDEIDALPYSAQAKLLRFLQEKEYRPVGSNHVAHADVRVIAASNRQLGELAARGVFRQDLFFRLNVLMLSLPALRERRDDVPQLAMFFLRAAAKQWRCAEPSLSPSALKKLLAHDWPGNVRELKNVIERAVLMCTHGVLEAADIDLDGTPPEAAAPVVAADESFRSAKARVVENFERSYIQQLLASNGGNVTHAARAAKKNRRAFFELMRKYRIEPTPYRPQWAVSPD